MIYILLIVKLNCSVNIHNIWINSYKTKEACEKALEKMEKTPDRTFSCFESRILK
jgi:hypothetical protein